jgi:RNA polymerase sigma-70 factor (ECF subfamily)
MDLASEQYYQRFQTVFSDYYSPLCSYAFTFVKSTDTSEDIVQEVFTRIWENRKDLIGTNAIRFYLFAAVRNNCITHLRREKKTGTLSWDDQTAYYDQAIPAKEKDSHTDHELLLGKAIALLPPKCREVFILSRLSHMKYQEIADTLGISIKTVENQLSKALKIMRIFLKEHGIYLVGGMLAAFFSR